MAENLLTRMGHLTLKERQESERVLGPGWTFQDRQRAIETMLEVDSCCASSMFGLGRSIYATMAAKLQGPPYAPPADQLSPSGAASL